MKLKLKRSESTEGLVFKKKIYELWISADLTDEERAAWGQCKDEIGKHIVAEYYVKGGMDMHLDVKQLLYKEGTGSKGFRMVFSNLAELAKKESEIKEGAKGVSNYLKKMMSAGAGDSEEEIEL